MIVRRCLRCNSEMVENLELKIKGAGLKLSVANKGTWLGSHSFTGIKVVLCPKWSYIELYVQDTTVIKKYDIMNL